MTPPSESLLSKILSIVTAGKSRRKTRKIEYFFYIVLYLIVVGDLLFSVFIFQYGTNAEAVLYPHGGYTLNYPIVFKETGTAFPLVYVFVTANTTTNTGLNFLTGVPITITANAYVQLNLLPAPVLNFTYHDAEPVKNGALLEVSPTAAPVSLVENSSGVWHGRETIYFINPGNYNPILNMTVGGQQVPLVQDSDFYLQVSPVSAYTQNILGQVELILAAALYFFGLIDSFILMKSIFPKAFPKERQNRAKRDNKQGNVSDGNTDAPSGQKQPQKRTEEPQRTTDQNQGQPDSEDGFSDIPWSDS